MSTANPTLSPAARARVEEALKHFACAVAARELHKTLTVMGDGRADADGARAREEQAEAALTATVAAIEAEAEARGREAAEARLNALRTAVVEFWGPPATIADLAQLSPAQQRLLDALAVARPATTERTPTPHAAWCQSRFPMRGAPLPCNCAGHRDEGEGAEDV